MASMSTTHASSIAQPVPVEEDANGGHGLVVRTVSHRPTFSEPVQQVLEVIVLQL